MWTTVTGPLRTLAMRICRCSAARHTGHSLLVQNLGCAGLMVCGKKRPMSLANDPIEGSEACLAPKVGFSVNDLAIAGEKHVAAHVMQRPW